MNTAGFRQRFPLFDAAAEPNLEALLTAAVERDYPAERAVLMEDAWGNAVYFIVEGLVRVRLLRKESASTLAVLGRGEFFGEMAVLDESPRSTDVVAIAPVKLLTIPAKNFVDFLMGDAKAHYRMLQLMVRRLRKANQRSQWRQAPVGTRIVRTVLDAVDSYGEKDGSGTLTLPELSLADIADLAAVTVEEVKKVMAVIQDKGWLQRDAATRQWRVGDRARLAKLVEGS
ncbi:MAG TPA: transcriptional regulator [Cyanobacteria bacterium UBA8156]|jgi:CRP-like cAMP-binding protein|nr:transcriptional regulator [Cyanobacteria bacterium UBA8156]